MAVFFWYAPSIFTLWKYNPHDVFSPLLMEFILGGLKTGLFLALWFVCVRPAVNRVSSPQHTQPHTLAIMSRGILIM